MPVFNFSAVRQSCGYDTQGMTSEAYQTLHNGLGTNSNAGDMTVAIGPSLAVNKWDLIYRAIIDFDTSTLTGTILSATITMDVLSADNNLLSDYNAGIGIVESLIKDTSINASKYNLTNINTALLSNRLNFSDLHGAITFTLNASGIANINNTGISAFAVMSNIDIDGGTPVWKGGFFVYSSNFRNALLNVTTQSPPVPPAPTLSGKNYNQANLLSWI